MNGSLANNLETHGSEVVNRPLTAVLTESGPQATFHFHLAKSSDGMGDFFSTSILPLRKHFPFVVIDAFFAIQTMIRMVNSFLYS